MIVLVYPYLVAMPVISVTYATRYPMTVSLPHWNSQRSSKHGDRSSRFQIPRFILSFLP